MKDDVTVLGTCRRSPVRMALFAALPLLLAAAQLLNSFATGLALWVALAFAAGMITYATIYTRYLLAQERLELLESGTTAPTAD